MSAIKNAMSSGENSLPSKQVLEKVRISRITTHRPLNHCYCLRWMKSLRERNSVRLNLGLDFTDFRQKTKLCTFQHFWGASILSVLCQDCSWRPLVYLIDHYFNGLVNQKKSWSTVLWALCLFLCLLLNSVLALDSQFNIKHPAAIILSLQLFW